MLEAFADNIQHSKSRLSLYDGRNRMVHGYSSHMVYFPAQITTGDSCDRCAHVTLKLPGKVTHSLKHRVPMSPPNKSCSNKKL